MRLLKVRLFLELDETLSGNQIFIPIFKDSLAEQILTNRQCVLNPPKAESQLPRAVESGLIRGRLPAP